MDEEFLARFRERSAYETGRDGPPDGFPKLPDLPLGRYTDPLFQALEDEYLFHRVWLYGVHDSELPKPGSYRLRELAGAPILFVRGDDGEVRAFRNACRHRGAPSCAATAVPHALARVPVPLVELRPAGVSSCGCPTSGTSSTRRSANDASRPCAASVGVAGTSSTSTTEAMPLEQWLDPIPRLLPEVAAAPLRVIDDKRVPLGCNWKILAEAFLEVYHARTIHPKTVGPSLDTRGTVISLFDHGHQTCCRRSIGAPVGDSVSCCRCSRAPPRPSAR